MAISRLIWLYSQRGIKLQLQIVIIQLLLQQEDRTAPNLRHCSEACWHCPHYAQQGLRNCQASVCLFIPSFARHCGGFAAGARRAGDIDRLLHGRAPSSNTTHSSKLRSAANASSVAFTAAVEDWTQTCFISKQNNFTHINWTKCCHASKVVQQNTKL